MRWEIQVFDHEIMKKRVFKIDNKQYKLLKREKNSKFVGLA